MKITPRHFPVALLLMAAASSTTAPAAAQESETPVPPAGSPESESSAATGFMAQTRVEGLLSGLFSPGIVLGYQGETLALGVGASAARASVGDSDSEAALTAWQLMPQLQWNAWSSRDGRVRAGLLGAVGIGQLRESDTFTSTIVDETSGEAGATTKSSNKTRESSTTVTYLPLRLSLASDYFVHRNFAVGFELGAQAGVELSTERESGGSSSSKEIDVSLASAFGAVRLTAVLGD